MDKVNIYICFRYTKYTSQLITLSLSKIMENKIIITELCWTTEIVQWLWFITIKFLLLHRGRQSKKYLKIVN